MSICPQCGGDDVHEFAFGSNVYCNECGEVVEPVESDLELWCYHCGDLRPMDESGCCVRCGETIDTY